MEALKDRTEELISHTGEYLDTFFKVSLLKVGRKTTNVASAAISLIVICIFGFLVLLFAGMGIAWWLGDLINSRIGGFLIIAGVFVVLGVVLILLRRTFVFPYVRNTLIRKIYDEQKN